MKKRATHWIKARSGSNFESDLYLVTSQSHEGIGMLGKTLCKLGVADMLGGLPPALRIEFDKERFEGSFEGCLTHFGLYYNKCKDLGWYASHITLTNTQIQALRQASPGFSEMSPLEWRCGLYYMNLWLKFTSLNEHQ